MYPIEPPLIKVLLTYILYIHTTYMTYLQHELLTLVPIIVTYIQTPLK